MSKFFFLFLRPITEEEGWEFWLSHIQVIFGLNVPFIPVEITYDFLYNIFFYLI